MWSQPLVLFTQLNSIDFYTIGHQYSFNQHTIFKSIDLQAHFVIVLFVYYQLICTTFINVRRKNKAKQTLRTYYKKAL